MKNVFYPLLCAIAGLMAIVVSTAYISRQPPAERDAGAASRVENLKLVVEGEEFTLSDGYAQIDTVDGSATKNTLSIFGEPVYGDLDQDETLDAALLVVNNPGGTGVFYYAVLALKTPLGYKASSAMWLGDRIAPQTVEIHDGRALYNFAERRADEPMTAQPSIGKSVWIHYDPQTNEIGEWIKDFEGESAAGLTELQARTIAEQSCIKGGEALAKGVHNKATQTWWFDANLNATRPGCTPACVVSEVTREAEINWRCTGAIVQ